MGCIASIGAIMVGQFRRCEQEMITQLPRATPNEILQPVVSLFTAGLFFTWAVKIDQGNLIWTDDMLVTAVPNKWNYSPLCMFFIFMSSSTHKYLQIRQDHKQMVAILCITASLFTALGVYDQEGFVQPMSWWSWTLCLIATTSYAHFFTKEEYLLKRRQITVLQLLDLQGQRVFTLYLIGIVITTIIQLCSEYELWIPGIYAKAVFSDWLNVLLTALTPIASGIMQAIMLTLVFNSSAIRFFTIMIVPFAIFWVCAFGAKTWVIVAAVFLCVGTVLYNLTGNCGQEAIDEYRTEVRMAMDAQEEVFFKAENVYDVQGQPVQQQVYVQQQPMYQQPLMQQNYNANQMV